MRRAEMLTALAASSDSPASGAERSVSVFQHPGGRFTGRITGEGCGAFRLVAAREGVPLNGDHLPHAPRWPMALVLTRDTDAGRTLPVAAIRIEQRARTVGDELGRGGNQPFDREHQRGGRVDPRVVAAGYLRRRDCERHAFAGFQLGQVGRGYGHRFSSSG
jgi:hypothetical protein